MPVITMPRARDIVAVPMDRLRTRCPDPQLSAVHRTDPFWGGIWDGATQGVWTNYANALRRGRRLPGRYARTDPDDGVRHLLAPQRRSVKLSMLAAVDGWRTVSQEQAATIVGDTLVADPQRATVTSAFCSSLLDIGMYPDVLAHSSLNTNLALYRPCDSGLHTFDRQIAPHLTWPEWLGVTGGRDWAAGGQFDRHNVLGTELGLRIAEYSTAALVLGEKQSTVDMLAGTGIGADPVPHRSADLCAVRSDGARVAFEITASTSLGVEAKVHKWAEVLARTPWDTSGLAVVFVAAIPPERNRQTSEALSQLRRSVESACRRYPGTFNDRTADRIGVVEWTDWFPGAHQVSSHFVAGRVWMLDEDSDTWTRRCLFTGPRTPDDELVRLDHGDPRLSNVLSSARVLGSVPYWMRGTISDREDFFSRLIVPTDQVPVPGGGTVGQRQGATQARPHRRLNGI